MSRCATGQSCASPPVNRMAIRRPLASASAWIFVLRPPRERPTACFWSPLFRQLRRVGFHMRGVDHLRVRGSSARCKRAEQIFPDSAPCPANKAVIDRSWRAIFGRAIAPAATTLQHMHDAADDAPIICPFDTSHIGRQMMLDPLPLLVVQPKQVAAHDPDPPENESGPHGIRIALLQQQINEY